jgi:hypothetical protein
MTNLLTFEAGKEYGNDLTITVLSRSQKTITIKTSFGVQRIKVRISGNVEQILFKCWLIDASEKFDEKIALENAMYRAYYM